MTRRVVIVGAGVSGTAAAFAAQKQGASVVVVVGRPGATSFGSGAMDGAVGDERTAVFAFLDALGIWELARETCCVATTAGLLRGAAGRDRAVLDFARVPPGAVAVVDAERSGWDAAALALAWSRESWASERGLRFEAVAVDAVRYRGEGALPDADFASAHDDAERAGWLLERMRRTRALDDKTAVVTGPWLGLERNVAGELSAALGKPVGEALSGPHGVAGLRFERARDRLFARAGIERAAGWARSARVDPRAGGARVELEDGGQLEGDAVILTVGGLIGGGLSWSALAPFIVSVASPAALACRGERLLPSGSPYGALFESFAWSGGPRAAGIERVGIWTDDDGRARGDDGAEIRWLFAAGDVVADAPRNVLAAVRGGLRAGAAAARGPVD